MDSCPLYVSGGCRCSRKACTWWRRPATSSTTLSTRRWPSKPFSLISNLFMSMCNARKLCFNKTLLVVVVVVFCLVWSGLVWFHTHCYVLYSWLPNNDELQEAMDSMVGNAYLYGRNYIATKVSLWGWWMEVEWINRLTKLTSFFKYLKELCLLCTCIWGSVNPSICLYIHSKHLVRQFSLQ